jgi:hypothetical protein
MVSVVVGIVQLPDAARVGLTVLVKSGPGISAGVTVSLAVRIGLATVAETMPTTAWVPTADRTGFANWW